MNFPGASAENIAKEAVVWFDLFSIMLMKKIIGGNSIQFTF